MGSPASPRNVGAVQPPPRSARLLHTRRTLSKAASSSYARSPPSSRLPLLGITLFAFPAAGRRVVVRCLTRCTLSSLTPVRGYIDRALSLSLSLSRIPPAMHAALHPPCRAHLGCRARRSLATTESVGLQSVFSTSRGEPRSLRLKRARISGLL